MGLQSNLNVSSNFTTYTGDVSSIQQAIANLQTLEQQLVGGDSVNINANNADQILNLTIQMLGLVAQSDTDQASMAGNGETYFGAASGSSTGDPHDSFSGTGISGTYGNGFGAFPTGNVDFNNGTQTNYNAHWDDMKDEPDLLHSDSFGGFVQVGTEVTDPDANGVTYNKCVNVSSGGDTLCINGDGNATINGNELDLQPGGQAIQLGNGESISKDGNGAIHVNFANANGGSLELTVNASGGHCDVSFNANNVALGGAMVNRGEADGGDHPIDPWSPRNWHPMPVEPIVQPDYASLTANISFTQALD